MRSLFVLTVSLKKLAEKCYSTFYFQFQFLTQCFCFDSLVVVAGWPLPEAKFIFKFKKKRLKFKLEELFSASSFGVCLYIKSDLHKILDNFYLNGFHIEETTSYDTMHSVNNLEV